MSLYKRAAVLTAGATIGVLAFALPASAHVTVHADSTAKGSFTELTFRVPTESDTASTTALTVQLPADTPLAYASVRPLDGWTTKVTKAKLPKPVTTDDGTVTEYVSEISWTAEAGKGIAPGSYQNFGVSGGPLPGTADSITFKAVQTYSDGDVVRWIDATTPGGAEPEHPAPTLALTAAADEAGAATAPVADSSDGTARGLGIAGIVVGVAGLGAGALALRSRGAAPQPEPAQPESTTV